MHDSHKIRTLLACIDDLTKAVQEMSAEATIHQADQDLLLYRSRLFYEAVLCMPTAEAVAPVAAAPSLLAESAPAAPPASVMSAFTEAIEQTIEAAVEQAIAQNDVVEVELNFETAIEPEATAIEAAQAVMEEEAAVVTEQEVSVEAAEVVVEEDAKPAAAVEVAAPATPVVESVADTAPAEEVPSAPVKAIAVVTPVAKTPTKSVAFSLTGIIERSGDSHLVMAHLKLKPIDDLKSGIGLNEKFLFIRELFGNDHLAYAEAIEKLNAAQSLNAAEKILASEVLPQQQWDLETEAALSFLHLIFRRFAQS